MTTYINREKHENLQNNYKWNAHPNCKKLNMF